MWRTSLLDLGLRDNLERVDTSTSPALFSDKESSVLDRGDFLPLLHVPSSANSELTGLALALPPRLRPIYVCLFAQTRQLAWLSSKPFPHD